MMQSWLHDFGYIRQYMRNYAILIQSLMGSRGIRCSMRHFYAANPKTLFDRAFLRIGPRRGIRDVGRAPSGHSAQPSFRARGIMRTSRIRAHGLRCGASVANARRSHTFAAPKKAPPTRGRRGRQDKQTRPARRDAYSATSAMAALSSSTRFVASQVKSGSLRPK